MEKFNRDKALKNLERKKNRNTYIKYGTFVFALCVGVFSITYMAYSKFVTTSEISVMEMTVGEFTQPTTKVLAYLDGEYVAGSSSSFTDGTYSYTFSDSSLDSATTATVSCTNSSGNTVSIGESIDVTTKTLTITDNTTKARCRVYFVTGE